jgi:hypothetical protein
MNATAVRAFIKNFARKIGQLVKMVLMRVMRSVGFGLLCRISGVIKRTFMFDRVDGELCMDEVCDGADMVSFGSSGTYARTTFQGVAREK